MTTPRHKALAESAGSRLYDQILGLVPGNPVGMTGVVESLHIAPVKSLGMLSVERAEVTPTGLATQDRLIHDRGTMLAIHKPGRVADGTGYDWLRLSQREAPMLAMTEMTYDPAAQTLTLSGPQMDPVEFHRELLDESIRKPVVVRLSLSGDTLLTGVISDNPVIRWVRTFLEKHGYKGDAKSVVFLRREKGAAFAADGEMHQRGHPAMTLFSDGDPIHVTSVQTLVWMNKWLKAKQGDAFREISMRAFRPNVVLNGLPANAEDVIRTVEFQHPDPIPMVFTCDCVRCSMTMIDRTTGRMSEDGEPLAWLKQHRPHREDAKNKPTFGYNALCPPQSYGRVITVGRSFRVTEAQ